MVARLALFLSAVAKRLHSCEQYFLFTIFVSKGSPHRTHVLFNVFKGVRARARRTAEADLPEIPLSLISARGRSTRAMEIISRLAKELCPMPYRKFVSMVSYRTGLSRRKVADDYIVVLLDVWILENKERARPSIRLIEKKGAYSALSCGHDYRLPCQFLKSQSRERAYL